MTIEQIRQSIIDEGGNPDDYLILPIKNGFNQWIKQYAPTYMKATEEIRQHDVGIVKTASQHATKRLVLEGVLLPDELAELAVVYDKWEVGRAYAVGDVFTHENKLYRVLQGHTSQADWLPNVVESLYTVIAPAGTVEEWGTRNLTTNPFMIGEQVRFEGQIWESIINNNVWSPTGYPQGWKLV